MPAPGTPRKYGIVPMPRPTSDAQARLIKYEILPKEKAMSPFMTVEVLMTESAHRNERKYRASEDLREQPAKRERRSRGRARARRSLRTLFRSPTWTSQSV